MKKNPRGQKLEYILIFFFILLTIGTFYWAITFIWQNSFLLSLSIILIGIAMIFAIISIFKSVKKKESLNMPLDIYATISSEIVIIGGILLFIAHYTGLFSIIVIILFLLLMIFVAYNYQSKKNNP